MPAGTPTPALQPAFVGCSGWMYDSWRGGLYPDRMAKRHWLERYAERFSTVEVNSTFYRLARSEAVAAWVGQTPDSFTFAVKASRYLTHVRRLHAIEEGIERFLDPLAPLIEAGRLGPILWQLPENFHRDDARLHEWLSVLPGGPPGRPFRHTIEFRHASWFTAPVLAALREHGVAVTIGDHPARPFQSWEATANWMFVRFHWGHRGRRGNYSRTEIAEWAARIDAWRSDRPVWAYFNNDWEGFAPANAALLERTLQAPSGEPVASACGRRPAAGRPSAAGYGWPR